MVEPIVKPDSTIITIKKEELGRKNALVNTKANFIRDVSEVALIKITINAS